MYTLIITFYVSLVAMILMIWLKSHEIRSGKPTIVSRLGKSTDQALQSIFQTTRRSVSYINKHTFIAIAQWLAYHVLLRIRNVYVEIKHRFILNPHGKRLIDAVRGRGEIKSYGASVYLRRISDR